MRCVLDFSDLILCPERQLYRLTFSRQLVSIIGIAKKSEWIQTWLSSSLKLVVEAVASRVFSPFKQDILSAPTHVGELAQDFLDNETRTSPLMAQSNVHTKVTDVIL